METGRPAEFFGEFHGEKSRHSPHPASIGTALQPAVAEAPSSMTTNPNLGGDRASNWAADHGLQTHRASVSAVTYESDGESYDSYDQKAWRWCPMIKPRSSRGGREKMGELGSRESSQKQGIVEV